jgi:hypothetical protein
MVRKSNNPLFLPVRSTIETLERRTLLALNPSGMEQEALEYINRMRQSPSAEYNLLVNSSDSDVNSAIAFFGVNKSILKDQFDILLEAPPLAWSAALCAAALNHNNAMLAADEQSHQVAGEASLGNRASSAGYSNYSTVGENVYAYAENAFHAHAGFAIDWGNAQWGIQNPPGHRNNYMSPGFREVGISFINSTSGKDVGPLLTTQDFGNRFSFGNPWYLGVVYDDKNNDGFYQAGEGLSGVTVKLTGGGKTYTATSMTAGGYQVQVPEGNYNITVSGVALGGTITSSVTIESDNVKQDFTPATISIATLTNDLLKISGTTGDDSISIVNEGSNLKVTRGSLTQSFLAAKVNRIEVYAYEGNDTVNFSTIAKNTYVDAGTGNDSVLAGSATDTLTGGAGKDTLKGGEGADRINGFGTNDQLFGEGGDDRIYGGDHDDYIDGGGGIDRLWGDAGNDTLAGASGADKIYGGIGNDFITGGSSNDLLVGEAGNDQLFGNDGNDTFDTKDGSIDTLNGGNGTDSAAVDSNDVRSFVETVAKKK